MWLANFSSEGEHRDAVNWILAQKFDVVSYSVGWINAGDGKGTGPISEDVRRAAALVPPERAMVETDTPCSLLRLPMLKSSCSAKPMSTFTCGVVSWIFSICRGLMLRDITL